MNNVVIVIKVKDSQKEENKNQSCIINVAKYPMSL